MVYRLSRRRARLVGLDPWLLVHGVAVPSHLVRVLPAAEPQAAKSNNVPCRSKTDRLKHRTKKELFVTDSVTWIGAKKTFDDNFAKTRVSAFST